MKVVLLDKQKRMGRYTINTRFHPQKSSPIQLDSLAIHLQYFRSVLPSPPTLGDFLLPLRALRYE